MALQQKDSALAMALLQRLQDANHLICEAAKSELKESPEFTAELVHEQRS